jgi:fumarate hydratase class I
MTEFTYQPMFPLGKEDTPYRHLSDQYVSTMTVDGKEILKIDPAGLEFLAEAAFKDVSHLYRPNHLASLAKILDDPESSENDRFVALEMLNNAVISAQMEFPMCQDTGTAIIMGKKGQSVWTGGGMKRPFQRGSTMPILETTCGIPRMRR